MNISLFVPCYVDPLFPETTVVMVRFFERLNHEVEFPAAQTCAVAIALTGTTVLDVGSDQGHRALTLLSDYHLCVVESEQVVGSLPEALERLELSVRSGRPISSSQGLPPLETLSSSGLRAFTGHARS